MSFEITTATRESTPLSIYLDGQSGSGKTYSALLLARGLAGPDGTIGIIDTEGGRSKIYADDPQIGGFQHMDFSAPFSPERCTEAFNVAVSAGWDVVIFDSASLEHDGEGGLIDMAEGEEERLRERNPQNKGITQQKWTKPKMAHKRFLNHIVGLPVHVILCFRTTLTTDFDKKQTVETVVAEKNTKFVLELHASIDGQHNAKWTRVPGPYLPAIRQGNPITVDSGSQLAAIAGSDSSPDLESLQDDMATMIASDGIEEEWFNRGLKLIYKGKYENWRELPKEHLSKLATDDAFAKVKAKAVEMMKQEGVV